MTTALEKLFVQIFERKDWIIEQVQQQADSYTQQLASTLLIDEITPPPWLLNTSYNSQSSDLNELGKEQIISKLLFRPPRDSVSFTSVGCSMYNRPAVAGGNGRVSNEMCMETHAPNKGLNVSNGPMATLECRNNDVGCSLNCVTEQDDSVNSPQNETDARISSIYAAPDTSLARIQRSKSRQKARKLRTNGKTSAKSCLSNENRTHMSFSGDSRSKSDFHQVAQDKCPSEVGKCNDINGDTSMAAEGDGDGDKRNDRTSHSGRIAKSSSSNENLIFLDDHSKNSSYSEREELDGGIPMSLTGKSLQQSGHVNGVMEGVNPPDASLKSITGNTEDSQIQNKLFSGRITRSRSSSQQTSGINKSSKMGTFVSCNPNECGDALPHSLGDIILKLNASHKLLDAVETSQVLSDNIGETQAIRSNEGVLKPVISSNVDAPIVTSSRSGSKKEFPLGANHQENAEIVVRNGPTDAPVLMQPVNASISLSPVDLCIESEGLALRQSSDCCMIVKPKQLNFDETGECYLNEICSSVSKKRKMDGFSGEESFPSRESASSIDHKSSSSVFEQQLPEANVLSRKSKAARTDTHCNIDKHAKDEMMNIGLNMNENPVVEDVEHNSEVFVHGDIDVICEATMSPKKFHIFDEEKNPEKSHLNKDHASLLKMQIEEVVLSSKSKAAMTDTHCNIDECAKDETSNTGLNMNENPVVEDVEHNSEVFVHDDIDVICEGDLGHKGEGNADGVYNSASKNTKSSFISSLTKQGNNDSDDCLDDEVRMREEDLGSSKCKEFEFGTNPKLSNVKLNSARVNTWPLNQQRNVEDQPNCLSDSRDFKVHIHRDAIHCDLEAPENDLNLLEESALILSSEEMHVSQSDGDLRVQDEMMCDLPEGTDVLHELQAAEPTVTEVYDDTTETAYTLKRSEPTFISYSINNAADDSAYKLAADVGAANPTSNDDVAVTDNTSFERSLSEWMSYLESNDDKTMVDSDEIMPVYEGFIINEEVEDASVENAEGGILSTALARASFIERICKSSSCQTPSSQFSSTFKQHQIQNLFGFKEDGILEHMDLGSTVSIDEGSRKHIQASDSDITEIDYAFPEQQNVDSLPFAATPICWQSKNHYSPPFGKFWERSASSSGSSEKKLSSNPELTCFPIEEDPNSNEESDKAEDMSDELQENISSRVENDLVEREPPTERTEVCFQHPIKLSTEMGIQKIENDDELAVSRVVYDLAGKELDLESSDTCSQHGNPVSTSMKYSDRCSQNSVNIEVSVPRTRDKVKYKPKIHPAIKVSRYEENRKSSIATRASSKGNVSLQNEYSKNKSSMRGRIPRVSQKEAKLNNIVSNVTSFIPIVQQKQAAAVCTGKRDIKVKALEAAEAAKRREQEKENERKAKKEALKVERARIEKENAREMELNKKKKQEEQKKKEADIAERKRQREEDDRKLVAKKRKLVAEARKEQKLQYEKSRAGKVELEKQHAKNAATAGNKKGCDNATENTRQNKNADENSFRKQDTELRTDKTLASFVQQVTFVPENHDASHDCGEKEKAISVTEKSPVKVVPVMLTSQEKSYDISPYQCSDNDEDEEEEDLPTNKFVPSWASKSRVAMFLPLQQKLDPETIFPVESFCSMDEVLLPRRLQAQ